MKTNINIPYSRYTTNIGDDVIVFSMKKVVEKELQNLCIDSTPTRDDLFKLTNEKKNIICGWLSFNNKNTLPIDIDENNILVYGVHFQSEENCYQLINCFKNRDIEVGCRDTFTLDICRKNNIKSYLSYCPTLLLDKTWNESNCEEYCTLVDVYDKDIIDYIERLGYRVKWLTHRDYFNGYRTFQERMTNIEHHLDLYSKSRFVISNKMHCILPCMSMGVPCIFHRWGSGWDSKRLDDYYNYFNEIRNVDDLKKLNLEHIINKDISPLITNKNKIKDFIQRD